LLAAVVFLPDWSGVDEGTPLWGVMLGALFLDGFVLVPLTVGLYVGTMLAPERASQRGRLGHPSPD